MIVKGKLSRRRICDTCRTVLWDVGDAEDQIQLPMGEPTAQKV